MWIETLFHNLANLAETNVEVEGYLCSTPVIVKKNGYAYSRSVEKTFLASSPLETSLILLIENSLKDFPACFDGSLGSFDRELLTRPEGLKVTVRGTLHASDASHETPYLINIEDVAAWIPIPELEIPDDVTEIQLANEWRVSAYNELKRYLRNGVYFHHVTLKYNSENMKDDERLRSWPDMGLSETHIRFALEENVLSPNPVVIPYQTTIQNLLAQGLLNQVITLRGNISWPDEVFGYALRVADTHRKNQNHFLTNVLSPVLRLIVEFCVNYYVGGPPYPQEITITGRLIKRFDLEEEYMQAGYDPWEDGFYALIDLEVIEFRHYNVIDLKEK